MNIAHIGNLLQVSSYELMKERFMCEFVLYHVAKNSVKAISCEKTVRHVTYILFLLDFLGVITFIGVQIMTF